MMGTESPGISTWCEVEYDICSMQPPDSIAHRPRNGILS